MHYQKILFSIIMFIALGVVISCQAPYFSQYSQDKYVHETFFKNKRNGVFIDIGAHDGINESNSYFFEKYLGWSGICVEPLSHVFPLLEKNRNCICINGCIAEFNGPGNFLKISGGPTEKLSGLIDYYDPRHLVRIDKEVKAIGGKKEIVSYPCYRFDDLLDEHGITHIDYLSIDTEGNELSILKTIDFEKVYVDIIGVENNYKDPGIRKFLTKHGYKFVKKVVIDEIYKKEK